MNTETITATATETVPCHCQLSITIPAAEVDAAVSRQIKAFSRQAKVPGFRPGKVPPALVRRRFGREAIDQARQELMVEAIQEGISRDQLRPVTLPQLPEDHEVELREGEDLSFTVEFDLLPKVQLPTYRGMQLPRPDETVDDAAIDAFVDQLREQRRRYDAVSEPAQSDDMLKVGYQADLGEAASEAPESAERLLTADETWLLMGEPEIFPGMIEGLSGHAAGAEVPLSITFPEDHAESFLAGRTVPYTFKILEVRRSALPEVDEAFARSFGVESVDNLREQVAGRLQMQQREQQAGVWRRQVLDMLLAQPDFPLPPHVLEYETTMGVARLERQRREQQAGDTDEQPDAGETPANLEEQRLEADREARERLKIRFLAQAVAEAESLTVTDEEVEARVEGFREMLRLSEYNFQRRFDLDLLRSSFRREILTDKVVERIIEQAEFVAADGAAAGASAD